MKEIKTKGFRDMRIMRPDKPQAACSGCPDKTEPDKVLVVMTSNADGSPVYICEDCITEAVIRIMQANRVTKKMKPGRWYGRAAPPKASRELPFKKTEITHTVPDF
jgi:hypothetical protein